MKNKDLIEKLQKLDPAAEVILTSNNFELDGANVSLENIFSFDDFRTKIKTFRDQFGDQETYQKEIWITGGNTKVIFLG